MENALKAWEKLAVKHDSDPQINKVYLQQAVFEGRKVMRMLSNAYQSRLDVYWNFGRVAALYTTAGLFSV